VNKPAHLKVKTLCFHKHVIDEKRPKNQAANKRFAALPKGHDESDAITY